MAVVRFPNPRKAAPDGIVGFGADLTAETLIEAYRQGIFPWPIEGLPLAWFCPPERAILEFKDLHVPRSLQKFLNKAPFQFSINRAFNSVIERCSEVPRPDQNGTWITPFMCTAYARFHKLGYAHSVEAWENDVLVGGIYGVAVEGTFAGESMFHLKPNASKLALLHLIEHLKSRGLEWMDIQMMTPHMERLGAKIISRNEFLDRLAQTQLKRALEPPLF